MSHRSEHAMLGPGGKIVIPRSESEALDEAITKLMRVAGERGVNSWAHEEIWGVIHSLKNLSRQVAGGYHRNPPRGNPPFRIVGEMGSEVHNVEYKHVNGGNYRHSFRGDNAQLIAVVRAGKKDLLITSERGVPLWDEFPDE